MLDLSAEKRLTIYDGAFEALTNQATGFAGDI
jgi:hypothetical protein